MLSRIGKKIEKLADFRKIGRIDRLFVQPNLLVTQVNPCDPVHGLDVILDTLPQYAPVHFHAILVDGPAVRRCLVDGFAQQSRLMHQFLWNAADINARTAKAPLCTLWRWCYEIQDGYFGAMANGLFGTGQATATAADHHQIVIVVLFCVGKKRRISEKSLESIRRGKKCGRIMDKLSFFFIQSNVSGQ